jgi:hypothetical protein
VRWFWSCQDFNLGMINAAWLARHSKTKFTSSGEQRCRGQGQSRTVRLTADACLFQAQQCLRLTWCDRRFRFNMRDCWRGRRGITHAHLSGMLNTETTCPKVLQGRVPCRKWLAVSIERHDKAVKARNMKDIKAEQYVMLSITRMSILRVR